MFNELVSEVDFYRKKVGELISCVLAKRMPVKQALLAFPKDVADKSVRAAWHALCHLEADEDLRKRNPDYAEEQDFFLSDIAETLSRGDELPFNVIDAYKEFYDAPLTPHRHGLWGFLASFEHFLNVKK
jgi:hypothetical protein